MIRGQVYDMHYLFSTNPHRLVRGLVRGRCLNGINRSYLIIVGFSIRVQPPSHSLLRSRVQDIRSNAIA